MRLEPLGSLEPSGLAKVAPCPLKAAFPCLETVERLHSKQVPCSVMFTLKIHCCHTHYCQADKWGHISVQPK